MKRLIGFLDRDDASADSTDTPSTARGNAPVKSLVKIRFASRSMELAYYNDRFDLHEGDVVYVSGKLAGEAGMVTSVTTKFRIHTADYERVLALLDLTLRGAFARVQDKMVCFDTAALTPEQFGAWVTPPDDPKKQKDEDADEIISGEGYAIDIHRIEGCEELLPAVAHRAVEYCAEGHVGYISVQNGIGCAYVAGTRWYRVDFRYADGMLTDLFCDCPYPGLCKHEAAVAFTLRMLLAQPQMDGAERFAALDRRLFWRLASRCENIRL